MKNSCKKIIDAYNKIYATKPIVSPKFIEGDMVQTGSRGIIGKVIGVEWMDYAGHYDYLIICNGMVFSKAEYVLNRIKNV